MKNVFLLINLVIYCTNGFAQQAKKALFIGIYEKTKRGICTDYEMVQMEVADYAEYVIKRKEFEKEHNRLTTITKFIEPTQSVICYKYEYKIVGWNCNSNVVSTIVGKSLEECKKLLADRLARSPNDYTTKPIIFFTWQGEGNGKVEYTKDYGGLTGKFISVNVGSKSIIVAKLTNITKDKLAYVLLKTDNGQEIVEYIYPNITLTRKYDTKNLDLKIFYLDSKKPKPTKGLVEKMMDYVRETVKNNNGKITSEPNSSMGVRG